MARLTFSADLLGSVLGAGAFGIVYSGKMEGTPVAVKKLKFALSELDNESREEFEAETGLLAHLRHPNIVSLIGVSEDPDGVPLMVCELMEGGSLDNMLYRRKLPITEAMQRTVALENIFVDKACQRVCLGDLGLSRAKGSTQAVYTMAGTLMYMAPEVILREGYGPPADMYSFGLVLNELAARARPFPLKWTDVEHKQRAQASNPQGPVMSPAMNPDLARLAAACYAHTPSLRLTAKAFLDELDRLPPLPVQAAPLEPTSTSSPLEQPRSALPSKPLPRPPPPHTAAAGVTSVLASTAPSAMLPSTAATGVTSVLSSTAPSAVLPSTPSPVSVTQPAPPSAPVPAAAATKDPEALFLQAEALFLRDEKQAFQLMLKVAEMGHADAQGEVAGWYLFGGPNVPMDQKKGIEWAKKASNAGSPFGHRVLAQAYETGYGISKDFKLAQPLYKKAALGNKALSRVSSGQNMMAYMLQEGRGFPKDPDACFKWYSASAAAGDWYGMCGIGWCYREGIGTAVNDATALQWFKKAAAHGVDLAQVYLGWTYEGGRGVAADYRTALQYFGLAAKQHTVYGMLGAKELKRLHKSGW